MIVASRINNKYELGNKLVIPITAEDYNKLKEVGHEKSHLPNHHFIIVSQDGGFDVDTVKEWEGKIKEYYAKSNNSNKINITDNATEIS